MKKILNLLLALVLMASCGGDDDFTPDTYQITLAPQTKTEFVVSATDRTLDQKIAFSATAMWRVDIKDISTTRSPENTAGWLRVDQYGGGADKFAITVSMDENKTNADRKAGITISCGDSKVFITVTQQAASEEEKKE